MEILELVSEKTGSLPFSSFRLPPFPQIAVRVMRMVGKEEVPMHKLCELISTDAAFASELLIVANSPLYAPRSPAKSLVEAIARLGTRNIQGLCLTVAARTYLGRSLNMPAMKAIWNHNLACALVAEQLARILGINKDDAYTAGMLHDIGRLAMAAMKPHEYAALLNTYSGSAKNILEAEWKLFGFDHCEAGRLLVESWQLPNDFDSIVAQHHATGQKKDAWGMTDLIRASCRMADAAGFAAFRGCEIVAYPDMQAELPARVVGNFYSSLESLSSDVSKKIKAIEAL